MLREGGEFVSAEVDLYSADWKIPIGRFESHVLWLVKQLHNGRLDAMSEDLSLEIVQELRKFWAAKKSVTNQETSIEDFITNLWKIHQELCAKLMFSEFPDGCRQLDLSLIELNSDFSGPPFMVIDAIREIDSGLLINPTLRRPQEGLGRLMTDEEAERLLRSFGSRVFLLQSNQDCIGYFMFLPEPTEDLLPAKGLLKNLKERGGLAVESSGGIGIARSLAVKIQGRLTFARAGINACDLLDQVMADTARLEGCHTLVATVRVGPNANTSIKSHQRHGWRTTGLIEGELEILVRHNAFPQGEPSGDPTQELDLTKVTIRNTRRRRFPRLLMERVRAAPLINDQVVYPRAKGAAEVLPIPTAPDVQLSWEEGRLKVSFNFRLPSLLITMEQLRPRVDLFMLSIDEFVGTLEESLEYLQGSAGRRHYRSY